MLQSHRSCLARPVIPRVCHSASNLQQTRALSLFGWGSSKPTLEDTHATTPTVASPSQSATPVIEPNRTISASHATSDTPAPTLAHSIPPHTNEPQSLQGLEQAISSPRGAELPLESELIAIPERIGYLKEVCGLDYGWGPTAFMEWCFESFHIHTGLPWAASIISVALIMRLAIFRTVYKAQENSARLKQIAPVITPLREEYKAAVANQDKQQMVMIGQQIRAVSKEAGTSFFVGFKPLIYQIPLQIGGFRLLRAAGDLPVPAFENESFYWISSLAMSDPYILPLITAASSYFMARSAGKLTPTTTSELQRSMMLTLKYVIPLFSFFFVRWQAAPCQLFFAASSLFTMAQTNALQNARVRRAIGLTSLDSPASPLPGQPTTPRGPAGGMRRKSDMVIDVEPRVTPQPEQNISRIDKWVDSVKGAKDKMMKPANDKMSERIQMKKKEAKMNQSEQYEYQRRSDAMQERDYRNEQTRRSRR